MDSYSHFVSQLKKHLASHEVIPLNQWTKDSLRFVDGLAADELRRLISLENRRASGAFFTSSELGSQLFSDSQIEFGANCIIYDPAVGAGNLLIAAYNYVYKQACNVRLTGTDLHLQFIQAAKLRLEINALLTANSNTCTSPIIDLCVANGLEKNHYYSQATHIITNPPFNLIKGDESVHWGKGKLSAAAVFIDRIIRYIRPGTPIIAILPEVLRSGSRYEKWRAMVDENCTIQKINMLGQFDKYADIDVFSVVLIKKNESAKSPNGHIWSTHIRAKRVVEDMFEVSVGNVVDNRDAREGVSRPFLISRGLVGWKVITKITHKRKFAGRSISGPFVVVKRTSRKGDRHRAVASIINVNSPIYVDNHLIVLKPKSGNIKDCFLLLEKLQTSNTDEWIDDQIRCRHLTVKIVARIPI